VCVCAWYNAVPGWGRELVCISLTWLPVYTPTPWALHPNEVVPPPRRPSFPGSFLPPSLHSAYSPLVPGEGLNNHLAGHHLFATLLVFLRGGPHWHRDPIEWKESRRLLGED
jgi:hypothetical protein